MDILNNIYILAVKDKHLIPTGLLLLINAIVKSDRESDAREKFKYLGDNVPLSLVANIKRARLVLTQRGK